MNWDYFLLYTEKARELGLNVGFKLYSAGHLTWLLVLAVLTIIMITIYMKATKHRKSRIKKTIAWALLIGEIVKDIVIVSAGAKLINYLPLHLCGFAIFFILADCYLKNQKITGQVISYACFPGAIAALLFCSWTALPIFGNFMCTFSFIFHWLIVCYALIKLINGEIVPTYKGLWITIVAIGILAVPTQLFNLAHQTNYLFIYKAQPNSPFQVAWDVLGTRFGRPGYVVGCAIIMIVVFHLMYLIYGLLGLRKRR